MERVIDVTKITVTTIVSWIATCLGGWDDLLKLYIILFVCDLVIGALKGVKTKNFSSSILFWGFINKCIALIWIAIMVRIDNALDIQIKFKYFSIVWFSICEGASILENSASLGVPVPDGICSILVQVRKGFSINITKIVKQIIDNYKIPTIDNEREDGGEDDQADRL